MYPDLDHWSYDSTRFVFNSVYGVGNLFGISVFALLLTWVCKYLGGLNLETPQGLENFHIFFMALFMIFIQGNASVVWRLLPTTPKYTTKIIHASMQFLVFLGVTFAFVVILEQHRVTKVANFTSLHSWLGLSTLCLFYSQYIFGLLVYLFPYAPQDFRTNTIPVHKIAGKTIFLFAVTACVTGIMEKALWSLGNAYTKMPPNALMVDFAGFFAVIFVASVIYLLWDPIFRRRASPFAHILPGSMGQQTFYGSTVPAGPSGVGIHDKVVY